MKGLLFVIILIILCSSCDYNSKFDNTINGIDKSDNTFSGVFFDKGSWFGIPVYHNGGPGTGSPLFLSDSNGYTIKSELLGFEVTRDKNNIKFDTETLLLPGTLFRVARAEGISIHLRCDFIDHQTLVFYYAIHSRLTADSKTEVRLIYPGGEILADDIMTYDLGNSILQFQNYDNVDDTPQISSQGELQHENTNGYFIVRHRFKTESDFQPLSRNKIDSLLYLKANRWDGYFTQFEQLELRQVRLVAKCIQTLIANWRAPIGELKHAGLFPSYAYSGFHGFWAWDSWKHAAALSLFEPELAKEQVRAMFDYQDEYGMIADCIFRDTIIENHNWRDTKPPLAAWAVYSIFEETLDTSFVREILPGLIKYHMWWYANRDHNNNGLCEYGSTDGTRIAAAWESGMDNAVRFDQSKLIKINDHAWSLNQESVDLNSYLYAEKKFIAKLTQIVDENKLSASFIAESELLSIKIKETFYSASHGYFFDINTENGQHIEVFGPEAWITLWSGVADSLHAKNVLEKIMDSTHFNTYMPFPTLSATHPQFDPSNGYWRGPVWLDQAYFALEGMRKYGFEKEYQIMKNKLTHNGKGILNSDAPIRENYHPLTGEGLNAEHFSWSAAHLLLLLKEDF